MLAASPAHAQLGGIMRGVDKAKTTKEKVDKAMDLKAMSEKDERALGEQVSQRICTDFGVLQDKEITKYVTLVGSALAQASTRPGLKWEFIVLDTEGVNAFAAPGGLVHVTKGLLGLMKNEAELAGALGHEITHITEKHTVNAIQKGKMVSFTADEVGSSGGFAQSAIARLAEMSYTHIIDNKFDRNDEMESDKVGVGLANKVGYAPTALSDVLKRIADRYTGKNTHNGMFASHPDTEARIKGIAKVVKDDKLNGTATVAARYTKTITFDATPLGSIDVVEGTRGMTGGSGDAKDDKAATEKKDDSTKKSGGGGLLGKFSTSSSSQKQSSQTVASAGARGIEPDRDAKGGSNPRKLSIPVTPAEIDAFRKGIA
jgi:predicted Zn-dependent protease